MSATVHRDYLISCNHPGCVVAVWGSHLDLPSPITPARTRECLRKAGWTVNVRNPLGSPMLDFCPEHNPNPPAPKPHKPGGCPDGGTCHHWCSDGPCFRVQCCGPLSGVYSGDVWPAEVMAANRPEVA